MIPIGGLSSFLGLRLVDATETQQHEVIRKTPQHARAIGQFRERIADIETVDQFIDDTEVYTFVMRAFDLEDQIFGKALIGKMLKSDIEDRKSLINRLTDPRLRVMYDELGFGENGIGNTNTIDKGWQEKVVKRYVDTLFVNAQGDQNETVGIALQFRRKAATVETPFDILKDADMAKFMRVVLGLPKEMAQVDIDRQAKIFESKYDLTKLQDPVEIERLVSKFVVISDALDGSAVSKSVAVQLMSSTTSIYSDGLFVQSTIDIAAISSVRGGY